MNTVLESLFLRRPRIEYVSPPVCPIHFSASGVAIFDQCFNDQTFCNLGKINTNFLHFDETPDALAYNVYYSTQQTGQPYTIVNTGIPLSTAVVFTAGTYFFTVNLANGTESGPFPPTVAGGVHYTQLTVPKTADTISTNLYKDGVKIISNLIGVVVESSAQGWYQVTKITADGESSLLGSCPNGGGPVLLSGSVPTPPPPPPPPPPGPDWTTFIYGNPVCLGCIGSVVSGVGSVGGGFSPPGAAFTLHTQLIGGNPAFEYVENQSGFVDAFYSGPAAHCRLTLVGSVDGFAGVSVNNTVVVIEGGVNAFVISGAAMYVPGSYDFNISATTGTIIRVAIQSYVVGSQNLNVAGTLSNIP